MVSWAIPPTYTAFEIAILSRSRTGPRLVTDVPGRAASMARSRSILFSSRSSSRCIAPRYANWGQMYCYGIELLAESIAECGASTLEVLAEYLDLADDERPY